MKSSNFPFFVIVLVCCCFILGDPGAVSQSGREKRRDESFQVRAKKPLGTDSHRTISKTSSRCRLLIGHKKCFVLLCPIGEQFFLSSFRELVHDGYCLSTPARFVHQASVCKGNLYFLLSYPETKELPMSRKNVWNAISRSNRICPDNIIGDQLLLNFGAKFQR